MVFTRFVSARRSKRKTLVGGQQVRLEYGDTGQGEYSLIQGHVSVVRVVLAWCSSSLRAEYTPRYGYHELHVRFG